MQRWLALVGAMVGILAPSASAQTFDPTFGTDGVVYVSLVDQQPVLTHPTTLLVHEDGSATTFGEAILRFTAGGRLDTTWGDKGMRPFRSLGGPVVRLPDGRFLAARTEEMRRWGTWDEPRPDSVDADFLFTRFSPDGLRDSSWGTNGEQLVNAPSPLRGADGTAARRATNDQVSSLEVEPDGRVVAVGSSNLPNEPLQGMVVRLLPDGSLDPSFGTNGIVLLPDSVAEGLSRVARQSDGRYVAAGRARDGIRVVRLLPDGRLDPSFGQNGRASIGIAPIVSHIVDVIIDENGRITTGALAYASKVFGRLLPDGSPDPAFGTSGVVQVGSTNDFGWVYMSAMALSPNGSILGVGGDGRFSHLTLLRPDGAVQETITPLNASTNESLSAVAARPDGRWLVAGMGPRHELTQFLHLGADLQPLEIAVVDKQASVVARAIPSALVVRSDGSTVLSLYTGASSYKGASSTLVPLDVHGRAGAPVRDAPAWPIVALGNGVLGMTMATFTPGRLYNLPASLQAEERGPFPISGLWPAAVHTHAEGGAVLAGPISLADGPNTAEDIGLMRVDQYAHPDPSFGPGGVRRIDLQGAGLSGSDWIDTPRALAYGPDGSLYLAGTMAGIEGVVRFAPDGTLDPAFGTGGRWNSPVGLGHVVLTWHPTYGLLVTAFSGIQGVEGVLARVYALHASGQPNTAFGNDGVRTPVHVPFLPDTVLPLHSGHVVALGTRVGPVAGLFVLRPDGTPETEVGPAGLLEFTGPMARLNRLKAAQGPAGRSEAQDRTITVAGLSSGTLEDSVAVFRVGLPAHAPTSETEDPSSPTFSLQPPTPTPTRDVASVRFSLDAPGTATLAVFDMLGREVLRLADSPLSAGTHTATLDTSALPPGRYLVRLSAGGHRLVQPLVRMR